MSYSVLVACEQTGIVRDCFDALGCDAWSCDLADSERRGKHVKGDAVEVAFSRKWDVIICHPPCRFLTVANNRNWLRFEAEQREAVRLALVLWSVPTLVTGLENPVGFLNTAWMPATQVIQPWQFGHAVKKRTCFWFKNFPGLAPTHNVADHMRRLSRKRSNRMLYLSPGPERWMHRSRTFPGVAEALARQITGYLDQTYFPQFCGNSPATASSGD